MDSLSGITVAEALQLHQLSKAVVLAGHTGLDRVIRSVTVMDSPESRDWIRGGELVLSNIHMTRDTPATQTALIRDLAERGVSALGIKARRYVSELPPGMLELANELGLPVIEMPHDSDWVDIITPLLTEIISRQEARLEASRTSGERFTALALAGAGLPEICAALRDLVRSPCAVLDAAGKLAAQATTGQADGVGGLYPVDIPWEQLAAHLKLPSPDGRRTQVELDGRTWGLGVVPLAAGEQLHGHFLLLLDEAVVNAGGAMMALGQASIVVTLEMVKRQAVLERERGYRVEFLLDLLRGNIESRDVAVSRARGLGDWNLDVPHAIMVVDLDRPDRCYLQHEHKEDRVRWANAEFIEAVTSSARTLSPGVIWAEQSDSVALLFPVGGWRRGLKAAAPRELKAIARTLKTQIQMRLGDVTVSIGFGRVQPDVMQWSVGHREARLALDYGRRLWGRNIVAYYGDLGTYRLLLGATDLDEAQGFSREALEGLDAQPQGRRDEMLRTLDCYFGRNRSVSTAAEELSVHVNTVRYRLRRVRELTGLDPQSAEDALTLEMALRVASLLGER